MPIACTRKEERTKALAKSPKFFGQWWRTANAEQKKEKVLAKRRSVVDNSGGHNSLKDTVNKKKKERKRAIVSGQADHRCVIID